MSYRERFKALRCKVDLCGARCFRRCLLCERPACRWHRRGSNHTWRCIECPDALWAEALQQLREQEREERERVRPGSTVFWRLTYSVLGAIADDEPPGRRRALGPRKGRVVRWRRAARVAWYPARMACAKYPGHREAETLGEAPQRVAALRTQRWVPRGPPPPRGPRPWLGVVALAVVLLLVCVPLRVVEVPAELAAAESSSTGEAWSTDVHMDPRQPRPGATPRPVPNQKRAPCTAGLELEVNGVCWLPMVYRPPACPPQTVAHEGQCLLPVATPRPVPVGSDAGLP
jgi:hypothetical protein